LDLEIEEGACLVVAGANGSGKTILMKIITGLMDATSGEILFRGRPLAKSIAELRRSVGLVFQEADSQILGETVVEDVRVGPKNLKMPREQLEKQVSSAIKAVGLAGKEDFLSHNLSGGEKRRLAVAGVLAMGCQTVIMDEPFANLDFPGVQNVLEIIKKLKESGKTLIILTHELEKVLAFAERLVILHRGKLAADGEPETVLDNLKAEYGVRDPRCSYKTVKDCTWL
jgi:biotin transport system ATP-binding protein